MTLKHQFSVHVGISESTAPQSVVRVACSYPHAGTRSIPERWLQCVLSEASPLFRAALAAIYCSVGARIPDAAMARLPHAEIRPTATPTVLTLALVDRTRASSLPRARLCYLVAIPELQSQVYWPAGPGEKPRLSAPAPSYDGKDPRTGSGFPPSHSAGMRVGRRPWSRLRPLVAAGPRPGPGAFGLRRPASSGAGESPGRRGWPVRVAPLATGTTDACRDLLNLLRS